MSRFGFEKLEVWQKAIEVTALIYQITKGFPDDERYGLTNQLRRSATSIAANIAEGSGRQSTKDFQRFIGISYATLMETVSHLYVARSQAYIQPEDMENLLNQLESISRMLSGLNRSLSNKT